MSAWGIDGKVPERVGNAHQLMAPYESFRTASREMVVAITTQKRFEKLCTLAEFAHLRDRPEYATQASRNKHRATLCPEVEAILMTQPVDYWLDHFFRLGLPAAPVNTLDEIGNHPHVKQRGSLIEVEYPPGSGNRVRVPGVPWRDVASKRPLRGPPSVGQHTAEVLAQFGIRLPAGK